MVWPAIIAAAAEVGGGIMQNEAASDEASWNRDWQESMSNSAYQRATEDMKKAGLNPMLAYSQGGASTPSGGAAPVPANLGKAVSSAMSAEATQAGIENTEAATAKTAADATVAQSTAAHLNFDLAEKIEASGSEQDPYKLGAFARKFRGEGQSATVKAAEDLARYDYLFPRVAREDARDRAETKKQTGQDIYRGDDGMPVTAITGVGSKEMEFRQGVLDYYEKYLGLDKAKRKSELYGGPDGGKAAWVNELGGTYGSAGIILEVLRDIWDSMSMKKLPPPRRRQSGEGFPY